MTRDRDDEKPKGRGDDVDLEDGDDEILDRVCEELLGKTSDPRKPKEST